jgi:beta-N-acetylhexosaminidase
MRTVPALLAILLILIGQGSARAEGKLPASPALEVKVGQMLMVGFRGLALGGDEPILADIRERHLGGVILFDRDTPSDSSRRNILDPGQVRRLTDRLQAAADIPLLVAVDQEGGRVRRFKEDTGFPVLESARALGRRDDPAATRRQALATARALAAAGVNLNLAPVVDLDLNPANPVIGGLDRSYGAEPLRVVRHARAFIAAHRAAGVLTCLKHFPGHGSSRGDTHLGLVDVTDTWQKRELQPFAGLIAAGQVDAVMTAHIVNRRLDPHDPATLSPAILDGLLRKRLGYQGVVISDDLQMGAIAAEYGFARAIRKALDAGVDILLFANNSVYDEKVATRAATLILDMVESGAISPERIEASWRRIADLKARLEALRR